LTVVTRVQKAVTSVDCVPLKTSSLFLTAELWTVDCGLSPIAGKTLSSSHVLVFDPAVNIFLYILAGDPQGQS